MTNSRTKEGRLYPAAVDEVNLRLVGASDTAEKADMKLSADRSK